MNSNDEDDGNKAVNLKIIREFFDAVDLDASGFIDERELAAVVDLPAAQISEIFKKLDTDGDGRISIEDFTENYRHFQKLSNEQGHEQINKYNDESFDDDSSDEASKIRHNTVKSPTSYQSRHNMTEPSHRKSRSTSNQSEVKRKAAKYLGQEYLDDLYEVARSRDDPMLLESLENFLTATVDSLLQKQADNEKLDTALRRATEKNTEIAAQLEEEMENQVVILEEKIRREEHEKLEQQKQEANEQLLQAHKELEIMEKKIVDLENKVTTNTNNESEIPDHFIDKIRNKEQENKQLQHKLMEFQTQMALMRTEVAGMKAEYDEQTNRLQNERGTVLNCVQEQENLTRQLQMLHEANKKLHDTNDDLRSALEAKRSNSLMSAELSPVKRSVSCAFPYPSLPNDFANSFRSDPGFRNSTMNNDMDDTDDESQQSLPHDDDFNNNSDNKRNIDSINGESLLSELMAADSEPIRSTPMIHPPGRSKFQRQQSSSERDRFLKQLEILCETNRRLGESNDELRNALSLLSDQVRSERGSDIFNFRESPQGCYSAPVTPLREHYDEERPHSTSSPRKVLLTKSGYNTLSESRSLPDINLLLDSLLNSKRNKTRKRPLNKHPARKKWSSKLLTKCNECGCGIETTGSTYCDACMDNDTDAVVDDLSYDEIPPLTPKSKALSEKTVKKSLQDSIMESQGHELSESQITDNSTQSLGYRPLVKENALINIVEIKEQLERSIDQIFDEIRTLPPSRCRDCGSERILDSKGNEFCPCPASGRQVFTLDENQLLESTILTESESESENYSEQETSHFAFSRRKIPFGRDSAKMSVYAHAQSDEDVDEDDMADEELIRLVDQTNEETMSISDEPITVEEKILEPRGLAAGSSASESTSSINTAHGEPDEMYKIVLAGNAAVGKSSFIIRLCKNKFYSALNSTLGVDFQVKSLEVDEQCIALQLWDTAGQERFRSIAKSYFRRVDGVVLLYDVTCENSFLDVRDWIESIESSNSDKVPIILCGNKTDLREDAMKVGMPVVTKEQGKKLANEVGALFIETSAKKGTNIHKACRDLIRMMQENEEEKVAKPTGITLEEPPKSKKILSCCRT